MSDVSNVRGASGPSGPEGAEPASEVDAAAGASAPEHAAAPARGGAGVRGGHVPALMQATMRLIAELAEGGDAQELFAAALAAGVPPEVTALLGDKLAFLLPPGVRETITASLAPLSGGGQSTAETTDARATGATREPASDASSRSASDASSGPASDTARGPATTATRGPAAGATRGSARDATDEPARDATGGPSIDRTSEPAIDTVGGPAIDATGEATIDAALDGTVATALHAALGATLGPGGQPALDATLKYATLDATVDPGRVIDAPLSLPGELAAPAMRSAAPGRPAALASPLSSTKADLSTPAREPASPSKPISLAAAPSTPRTAPAAPARAGAPGAPPPTARSGVPVRAGDLAAPSTSGPAGPGRADRALGAALANAAYAAAGGAMLPAAGHALKAFGHLLERDPAAAIATIHGVLVDAHTAPEWGSAAHSHAHHQRGEEGGGLIEALCSLDHAGLKAVALDRAASRLAVLRADPGAAAELARMRVGAARLLESAPAGIARFGREHPEVFPPVSARNALGELLRGDEPETRRALRGTFASLLQADDGIGALARAFAAGYLGGAALAAARRMTDRAPAARLAAVVATGDADEPDESGDREALLDRAHRSLVEAFESRGAELIEKLEDGLASTSPR